MLLIPMDMPKNCDSCPFFDDIYTRMDGDDMYYCNLSGGLTYWEYAGETEKDCPLVEVPPHGRLIDADALQTEAFNRLFSGFASNRDVAFVNFLLTDAPTVIPADEEATP